MTENPNSEKAKQRYLQGAELAQQGEYELAAAEMAAALELDPSLSTNRLQLGLLHLTQAQPQKALEIWAPLENLDDGAALKYFKRGLEALIRDDFAACIQLLQQGIALNASNAPLNNDMRLVIQKAMEALKGTPRVTKTAPQDTGNAEVVHTDFSLYNPKSN